MTGTRTFETLVERCGLSPMFAANAMARALARAGVWPEKMTMSDLPSVFPEVERALKPFMVREDVERTMESLRAWWWKESTRPTVELPSV